MKTDTPKTIYLKDYKPYSYDVESIDLNFDIREGETFVTAKTKFKKKINEPLFLNGEDLEILSIQLDGKDINDYALDDKGITIPAPKNDNFTVEIKTKIKPEENTRLEGLYMSGGNYCTQCEAEGFRRITYYPDRPDVLTTYTVRVEADKKFPVLLSNGNLKEKGTAKNGRHFTVWHDPFPKPCYLFALVAGDLEVVHDTYTTGSGRKVDLYIYVRKGDENQCTHAMESLKKSMKWDEDVYGLEYDLDLFNIVAVSDFNMGAMENKSLNIFNTALVLAHQETATDRDFLQVEGVVAHEYFHNWSGNRVTCRDWFQLSLKEGLTVFRDQEFSSDLNSRTVQRIDDVAHLRRLQFAEDAGPLAHPIRPDNYIEINNFYTMTVYEKGAEVIRMMHTILGPEKYRKGTDLYFSRHDGHAATCDDFVKCMEEASGIDLSQFKLWYSQAGTPEVTFKGAYDAAKRTYTIEMSQNVPDTPGQTNKKPMHIPVALGLLDKNGRDIPLLSSRLKSAVADAMEGSYQASIGSDPSTIARDDTMVLHLKEAKQTFTFENIPEQPIPSVLRNFSAPVRLKNDVSDEDLAFLMSHDTDGFNRWEAGQIYALRVLVDNKDAAPFIKAYGELLDHYTDQTDKALLSRALSLPDISTIIQNTPVNADPAAIFERRQNLIKTIKQTYKDKLTSIYDQNRTAKEFRIDPEAMGQRSLQNALLNILTVNRGENCTKRAIAQYQAANNMTDRVAAMAVLSEIQSPESEAVFKEFYDRFRTYPLVVDKWFALQAGAVRPDIIQILNKLSEHPDFNIKNPNRVRSLYASFAMNNPVMFHAQDGSGYQFLCNAIIKLNSINPQIAARLLTPLREWKRYTPDRQEKMKAGLQRILKTPNLAPDVFEIASKSLNA